MSRQLYRCLLGCFFVILGCFDVTKAMAVDVERWEVVNTNGIPVARHEAGLIAFKNKIYLLGGRRINPVNALDVKTLSWVSLSNSPLEMHHFQPVVWQDRIIVVGAMTGGFPNEKPLSHIYFYYPQHDLWKKGPKIPKSRRRGGAGVVVHDDKLFLVGGIVNGHVDGYVNWLDEYDLKQDRWKQLPDAPHRRDHFQAVYLDGKIYAVGGRRTSKSTRQIFDLVVPEVDVFDIDKNTWSVLDSPLPTPRAGNTTFTYDGRIFVVGGESMNKETAHNDVEVYDPKTAVWQSLPPLNRGRHGTGIGYAAGYLWTASGSGNRGGAPELTSTERLKVN